MQLGHLLTRSGLTYLEVSSEVCHDSFCQLVSSVTFPLVIYCEEFDLHVLCVCVCVYLRLCSLLHVHHFIGEN